MGAEAPQAAAVDPQHRHRPGLAYPTVLAGNPAGAPRYGVTVKAQDGQSITVADPRITRLAVALMDMNAVHGGAACHWGGPAAYADMMAAIHGLLFAVPDWRQAFNFVNDAGHAENGLYALKANYGYAGLDFADLKGFRSISSKLSGHGEGHLFPEGICVSNGPLGSGLPIAQGMAMADRVAGNDRVSLCVISDGAMMEGEAKEAVAAIPGFAAKAMINPFVLVISDNNTKLSGRIDEQSFTMQPSFAALDDLGWQVVPVADGHDVQALFTALETAVAAAREGRPVALWVKTVKGYGVKSTEQSSSGGHGYPLKDGSQVRAFAEEINGGPITDPLFDDWIKELEAEAAAKAAAAKPAAPGAVKKDKVQAGFPKAMQRCADEGLPVVAISADLAGSTGVAPFTAAYPQFSIDVGIAEANMVSVAAGFSKQGFVPVADTFVQFGVTKGNLPLCMASLSQAPVLAVFSHCGFQDAADGASHQGLYYIAATAAIPHLSHYCPATAEEAEWAMETAIRRFAEQRLAGELPDSVLFFCGRENFPVTIRPEGQDYAWGTAMTLVDTSADHPRSVVISAVGYMAHFALAAAQTLAGQGIGAIVLQNATPNHPDVATHAAALARCDGRLITVEDHQRLGGAGSILVATLADQGVACRPRILGVPGHFGQSAYMALELYDRYGIGPQGIVSAAQTAVA